MLSMNQNGTKNRGAVRALPSNKTLLLDEVENTLLIKLRRSNSVTSGGAFDQPATLLCTTGSANRPSA